MEKFKTILYGWLNSNNENGETWTFADMDLPLLRTVRRLFLYALACVILAIMAIPMTWMFQVFAMFFVLGLIICAYALFTARDIFSGKVLAISGTVSPKSNNKKKKRLFSFSLSGRGSLVLRLENNSYLKVFPRDASKYDEGDKVVVYVYERSLREENKNTLTATEMVAIDISETVE